jgi:adenine phosphoribosyltransferase|tara:strand:- start:66 stop:602 length:537 start_codon:yes stop_codon:yes gene_type:complete
MTVMINYSDFIRTVPDYPIDGVNFYDVNSLFADNKLFGMMIDDMSAQLKDECSHTYPTHIAGLESRGFVIGAALAYQMGLPFVMIRKKGAKYPGTLLEQSYGTEYSTDAIVLQDGLLGHTDRVILADDLIATGGSMIAARTLVESTGAKVVGISVIIDLSDVHCKDYDLLNVIALDTV